MNTPTLTLEHLLNAFGIASAFVFWPVIAKYSGASGAWVTVMALVGSAIGGAAIAYPTMKGYPIPGAKAISLLLFAGVINGIAAYFYAMKAVDPMVPNVIFIMMVVIMMIVVAPIFGYFLNGDVLSAKQWAGLGTAILAIYLLAS